MHFFDNFVANKSLAKVLIFKSYFFYSKGYFKNSILSIDNFLLIFPYNNNILYLCYLKCMCYYSHLKYYKINKVFISYSKFLMILFVKYFYYSVYIYKLKKRISFLNNYFLYYDIIIHQNYLFYKKYISSINKLRKIVNFYKMNVYNSIFFNIIIKMYYSLNRKHTSFKYFYFFINKFDKSFFYDRLCYMFYI